MDFRADCLTIAPALLGWELISHRGDQATGGRIVEVEAYHGLKDPASHAFRGQTLRTVPMFEAGGIVYVYLSYGLHTCLNLVTGPAGDAQAVLIRALEPTVGVEAMSERRHTTNPRLLASGPGRVGQALGVSLADSGRQFDELFVLKPPVESLPASTIRTGPRVGIRQAIDRPWRFWIAGNPFVTRPRV
jgi:DNA-3-methyladenine glycosylase